MNKKFLKIAALLFSVTFFLMGCGKDAAGSKAAAAGEVSEEWQAVSGNFVREGSSQYTNAVLKMKYLSNGCLMFEFDLMEGSESEDTATNLVIPGVLVVDDKGKGHFESDPDAENKVTIDFALSADGKKVTVTHTGTTEISPDGTYDFTDASIEVSDTSAIAILEHLSTAATSLNSNNGAYTVEYPDTLAADWFYPVQAVFNDSKKVLAKFLIAKDLSAVYRADDDIEPVLIFGSAQPMLNAETLSYPDDDEGSESGSEETYGEKSAEPQPVASVSLAAGTAMTVGSSAKLTAELPWELPYTVSAKSSDNKVATVSEDGTVTAVGAGEAKITGTLSVSDAAKEFSLDVSVTEESLEAEN